MSYRGKHRKPSSTSRRIAGVAVAGAAVATPLLMAAPAQASGMNWDAVAQCESGGNWSTNSGNGFSGGLQFTPSTWRAYGGSGNAYQASREQQIAVAERVLAAQGPGAWPVCSHKSSGGSVSHSSGTAHVTRSAPVEKAAPAPSTGNYTVQAGDTLSSIAAKSGSSWSTLFSKNASVIKDANLIFPGQQLNV